MFHSSPAVPDDADNFTAQVDSAVTVGNSYGPAALTFGYRLTNVGQTPPGAQLYALGVPMPGSTQVRVDQAMATGNTASQGINTGSVFTFFRTLNPLLENQVST